MKEIREFCKTNNFADIKLSGKGRTKHNIIEAILKKLGKPSNLPLELPKNVDKSKKRVGRKKKQQTKKTETKLVLIVSGSTQSHVNVDRDVIEPGQIHMARSCGHLKLQTNDPKLKNQPIFVRFKYDSEKQFAEKDLKIKLLKTGQIIASNLAEQDDPYLRTFDPTFVAELENGKVLAKTVISFTISGLLFFYFCIFFSIFFA